MGNMTRKNKGFTIIEVALVLAIAGLIFLVVFLALPALQRNQRDTARRQNVGTVVSALQSYSSDSQGVLTGLSGTCDSTKADGTGLCGYTGALSQVDKVQIVTSPTASSVSNANDTVLVAVGYKCGSDPSTLAKGTSRNAAATLKLESGGTYCSSM